MVRMVVAREVAREVDSELGRTALHWAGRDGLPKGVSFKIEMKLRVVDPLAGKEAVIDVNHEEIRDLDEFKRRACDGLQISVPTRRSLARLPEGGDDRDRDPSVSGRTDDDFLERVTLTLAGKRVEDIAEVVAATRTTESTATLVCFVRPRLFKPTEEDEVEDEAARHDREVDELFRINTSVVPPAVRRFLVTTCRLPEWTIAPMTHVRARHAVVFAAWLAGSKLASRYSFGPPYLLGTLFYLMWSNLSTVERREGEWSAYSIFNRGVRRLGTFYRSLDPSPSLAFSHSRSFARW